MQEEDPGVKKVQHIQMIQRVHEKRSTFDSFDSFGFPVLLSVPLETEATAGQVFTNEKLYELVFETVKSFLTVSQKFNIKASVLIFFCRRRKARPPPKKNQFSR